MSSASAIRSDGRGGERARESEREGEGERDVR